MPNEIPDYDDGPRTPMVPVLEEDGVRMVPESDFLEWLDAFPDKRPPGWTAENQRDAINTLGGSANLSAEDYVEYAGLKGVDIYDVLNDVMLAYGDAEQNTDEVELEREISAFLSREREQEAAAQIPPDLSSELSPMSPEETSLPDTPYQQSRQRTLAAAGNALSRDDEGTYRDTGLTSYNETRHPGEAPGGGTLIRASATPFYEYEYDPEALRQAKRDTRQSEIDYKKELARKEAERPRRGRQDPNPTLGPSMTE